MSFVTEMCIRDSIYTEYKKGSDEYNAIAQMAVTERDPDQDSTSESEEAA